MSKLQRYGFNRLASREIQYVRWLCHGYTDRRIADKMQISLKTANNYRMRVFAKIGATHAVELAMKAVCAGIVKPCEIFTDY